MGAFGFCVSHPVEEKVLTEFDDIRGSFCPDNKHLTLDAVRNRLRESSMDDGMIAYFLQIVDSDGDGKVTKFEFDDCYGYLQILRVYSALAADEKQFNPNHDGKVGSERFKFKLMEQAKNKKLSSDVLDAFMKHLLRRSESTGKVSADDVKYAFKLASDFRTFNQIDRNQDGELQYSEVVDYFTKRSFPDVAISLAFQKVDDDDSGTLNFEEFYDRFIPVLMERRAKLLAGAFGAYPH